MKFLKIHCPNCSGGIEYPSDAAGAAIDCPHCQLRLILPAQRRGPRILFIGLATAVLAGVGLFFWQQKQKADQEVTRHIATKRQSAVTGQIFIVTQGGDNVKLGAVEVLVIEKPQVTDFLQNKWPAIDLVITSRQQALAAAKEDAQKAQAAFDWFLTNGRPAPNADFVRITAQIDGIHKQEWALNQQFNSLDAQYGLAKRGDNSARADALLDEEEAITKRMRQMNAEAALLLEKGRDALRRADAEETNKLEVAKSRVVTAEACLENSPTAEDYLADFSPVVFEKTLTDADGKFSLEYPRNKAHTIFAKAQRGVLNKTEKYYWLVNAPTNAETAQVFLSNNNLIFIDPDGYFKVKAKRGSW